MIPLGPASATSTGGRFDKGVWTGLPFAPDDTVERYVTSEFGAFEDFRRKLGWSPHHGIDLHAATGTPIHALGPGEVEIAGKSGFFPVAGTYVQIYHGNGLRTFYLHLSKALVSVGERVERGQLIGKSGATSSVSIAPHLHLGVNIDNVGDPMTGARVWVDPALIVSAEIDDPVTVTKPPPLSQFNLWVAVSQGKTTTVPVEYRGNDAVYELIVRR